MSCHSHCCPAQSYSPHASLSLQYGSVVSFSRAVSDTTRRTSSLYRSDRLVSTWERPTPGACHRPWCRVSLLTYPARSSPCAFATTLHLHSSLARTTPPCPRSPRAESAPRSQITQCRVRAPFQASSSVFLHRSASTDSEDARRSSGSQTTCLGHCVSCDLEWHRDGLTTS